MRKLKNLKIAGRRLLLTAFLTALIFSGAMAQVANKWTPVDNYDHDGTMTGYAIVLIDGTEIRNPNVEVGAFIGSECRGTSLLSYFTPGDIYVAALVVSGYSSESGSAVITFKVYDHDTDTEYDVEGTQIFVVLGNIGTLFVPYEIIAITVLPEITTPSLPNGKVGESYSQTLTAIGKPPITWSIASGSLPAGLTLSSGGVISGTPTTSGTFTFTVAATSLLGSDTKVLMITVDEKTITSRWTPVTHYDGSMTGYAIVIIDGTDIRNPNVEVGAFIGGECRAASKLLYFPLRDIYVAALFVSGSSSESGSAVITFKVYDHDTDTEYDADNSLIYIANGDIGTLVVPYEIIINTEPAYTIVASAGVGGSIVPQGNVRVIEGDDQEFTFAPESDCFVIDTLWIDDLHFTINDLISPTGLPPGITISPAGGGRGWIYTFENVTENHTIRITFKQLQYNATISAGTGGAVSGGGTAILCGTLSTITATPDSCHTFVKWTEADTIVSLAPTVPLTITTNRNLTAHFERKILDLFVLTSPGAGGTVSGNDTEVFCGTQKTVIASPNSCYTFIAWTEGSAIVSTDTSYTFILNNTRTLTANFIQKSFNVAVSTEGGGAVSGGGTSILCGTLTTITATPDSCHTFLNWTESDTIVSLVPTVPLTITTNRQLTANFQQKTFNLTVSAETGGEVTGGGTSILCGTLSTITATPDSCHTFLNWTEADTIVSFVPTLPLPITTNRQLTAHFQQKTLAVTVSTETGGSVSGGGTDILCGTLSTITATPDSCHTFLNWTESDTIVSLVPLVPLTITTNRQLTAHFQQKTFNLTISAETGGEVTGGGTAIPCGTLSIVTATPDSCHTFLNWTEADTIVSLVPIVPLTVTTNRTLLANFTIKTFTLTASAGANGSITPTDSVTCGANKTFTITPERCYEIEKVLINGVDKTANLTPLTANQSSYTFENVQANQTISVTFKEDKVTPAFPGVTTVYTIGDTSDSLPLTSVNGIKGNWLPPVIETSVVGIVSYTFYPEPDECAYTTTIQIKVKPPHFVITATAGANGTITPDGYNEVEPEEDQTFIFTPNAGYEVDKVYVDGMSVSYDIPTNSYTFENVSNEHAIVVLFKSIGSACPNQVYDAANHIIYNIVGLEGLCWTKENIRGTLYAHGGAIPFAKPYIYFGIPVDAEIFGLLYTWYSATGVHEDFTAEITCNMQGICPNGWRLPTQAEWHSLQSYSAKQLKSTQYWLDPHGGGTNETGFNAVPAGWYNGTTNRFEDLYGFAGWWASDAPAETNTYYFSLIYYCNDLMMGMKKKNDAMSVRCVFGDS